MAFDRLTFVGLVATGSDDRDDRVVELAALRTEQGKPAGRFETLADPGVEVPLHVLQLTGIEPADLADRPDSREATRDMLDFVVDSVVVAWNAEAMRGFLRPGRGKVFVNLMLDVQELARIVLPTLENYQFDTILRHFEPDAPSTVRAMARAEATAQMWTGLLAALGEYDQAVLQAINRLVEPLDCPLKRVFHDADWAKVKDFRYAIEKDLVENLPDFTDLHKSANRKKEKDKEPAPRTELDVERIGELFGADGPFAKALPSYEPRPEQVKMARTVAEAFNTDRHAMIEAGTGTGKSLAYLVPAVCWAKRNREQIVISTNTKNLQEQLFNQDVPLVRRALDEDFSAAIIKGRANYICPRKLAYLLSEAERELSENDRLALLPILTWISRTATGDISENSGFLASPAPGLWPRLYSTGAECFNRRCRQFRQCFLMRARALALAADLVIANHSVVFSEMGLPSPVLPEYKRLVFDEAHNIEAVATEHLGRRIDRWRFTGFLDRLFRRGRVGSARGLLANIAYWMTAGDRVVRSSEKDILEQLEQCSKLVPVVQEAGQMFLNALSLAFGGKRDERVRYRAEDRPDEVWEQIIYEKKAAVSALADLTSRLRSVHDKLDEIEGDRDFLYRLDFVRELGSHLEQAQELSQDIEFVVAGDDENYVYWAEQDASGPYYSLAAAPIDISLVMLENLYDQKESIIFASATLTVGNRFDFLSERIGTGLLEEERIIECDVGTPFDYDRQVLLCVPTFLPEPGPNGGTFEQQLTDLLIDLHTATRGRGLVLFTSYQMLNMVYPDVKRGVESAGYPVLGQGHDGGRDQLTSVFRRVVHSVLLGTHSFWEGVDVPGESLSCLTIAKLPFAVFTDPIVAARCEAVEHSGRNAFMHYSVPSAVVRLRQGFGRLIRHRNDRGVVILADRRVLTRQYGRQFLSSLPARHQAFGNKRMMIETVRRFLDGPTAEAASPEPPRRRTRASTSSRPAAPPL